MQLGLPSISMTGFSLRPIQHSDAADWYAYLSMPYVVEHTSWSLKGPDDLLALIESYRLPAPASPIRFALQEDLSGRLFGNIRAQPNLAWAKERRARLRLTPITLGPRPCLSLCQGLD